MIDKYQKYHKVLIDGNDIKKKWKEYFKILFNEDFPGNIKMKVSGMRD